MLSDLVMLGVGAGLAATTLTQSAIFRWLQEGAEKLGPWPGKLFNCAFCMGHWTAMIFTFAFFWMNDALWWELAPWVNLGITWLAVTGVAAITSGVIGRLHAGE